MKTIEARKYEMLVRVRDFGRTYGSRFPEFSYATNLFGDVESIVKQLGDHAVSTLSAARDGTVARRTSREALLELLQAMDRIAQALEPEITGLGDTFALPLLSAEDDQGLLAVARLFARDAVPYEKEFVGHGMGASFPADLAKAIDGLDQAVVALDKGRDAHYDARAGINSALVSGMNTVNKIDALVRTVLGNDSSVMAVWDRDQRVQYPKPRRSPGPAPAAQPAPAVVAPTPVTPVPPPAPVPASPPPPVPVPVMTSASPVMPEPEVQQPADVPALKVAS